MGFDADGYPPERALERIAKWPVGREQDLQGLLDFIEEHWWEADWGFRRDDSRLELHTLGWSGNESILGALKKNFIFWGLYWKRHDVGGHYYFAGLPEAVG